MTPCPNRTAGDLPAASLQELTLDCCLDANERAPRCLRLGALTQLTRLTLRGHGSHRLITYEETPKVPNALSRSLRLMASRLCEELGTLQVPGRDAQPQVDLNKGCVSDLLNAMILVKARATAAAFIAAL